MDTKRDRARPAAGPGPAADEAAEAAREALTAEVGQLVRQARAKRGMTRKALAVASGTSERYLAQIEMGDGNPTVLVLDAIARGLDLGLLDLLPRPATGRAPIALFERLRHLPATDLQATERFLDGLAAPARRSARGRRVALVGLRGAGKSTLGRALAARLGAAFVEIDREIERNHGAPIATLFEVYGQSTFRRYEREAVERAIADREDVVMATPGGIVVDEQTYAHLLERSHVVWLKASPVEHMRRVMEQGDFRPMARNREAMADLVAILDARKAEYRRAHAELDTSGKTPAECGEDLLRIVTRLFAEGEVASGDRA